VLLCVVIPSVGFAATESGYKVHYDGGSIQSLKSGDDIHVLPEQKQIRLVKNKKDVAVVPASSITEVSYGQDVHRRVGAAIGIGVVTFGLGALMALAKSKKHFIGLTWDDGGNKGGFAFQARQTRIQGYHARTRGPQRQKGRERRCHDRQELKWMAKVRLLELGGSQSWPVLGLVFKTSVGRLRPGSVRLRLASANVTHTGARGSGRSS